MNRILFLLLLPMLWGKVAAQHAFNCIPLGTKGGIDESNLSCYLLAANGSQDYISLDAGTLHAGLQKALASGAIQKQPGNFLKENIKGYCISHPHLDHLAGLIINSPDDTSKYIYGLPHCLDVIKDNYFSWKSWANFGDAGEQPAIGKYHYEALNPGQEQPLKNTGLSVKAFPLSHVNPYQSTAFLVGSNSAYILYLGDTGADEIEKSTRLYELWQAISPLVKTKRLKGIFIEVSYPDAQPLYKLFGHLTPALLMKELNKLASLAGAGSLEGLPIIITHMKPSGNNEAAIEKQLRQRNSLQVKLVFPKQAVAFPL